MAIFLKAKRYDIKKRV